MSDIDFPNPKTSNNFALKPRTNHTPSRYGVGPHNSGKQSALPLTRVGRLRTLFGGQIFHLLKGLIPPHHYLPQAAVEAVAAGRRVLGAQNQQLVSVSAASAVLLADAGDTPPVVESL